MHKTLILEKLRKINSLIGSNALQPQIIIFVSQDTVRNKWDVTQMYKSFDYFIGGLFIN